MASKSIYIIIILILAILGYFIYTKINLTNLIVLKPNINVMRKNVVFNTADGVEIHGIDFTPAKIHGNGMAVILLHMMPATKESWVDFADALAENGFEALAIDLRGHGETTKQFINKEVKKINYKNFSDKDHATSIEDVIAANKFLNDTGFTNNKIFLAGASIGANLSIEYATENSEIKKIIALSPGLDYRGIKTEPFVTKLKPDQKIFAIATAGDKYSSDTATQLYGIAQKNITAKIYDDPEGHGTDIFKIHKELITELIKWLKQS